MRLALEVTRPGGQLVVLGKINVNQEVALALRLADGREAHRPLELRRRAAAARLPWLARLYLEGRLKLDELITSRLPLDGINDGFAAMRRGEGIRHVVVFD